MPFPLFDIGLLSSLINRWLDWFILDRFRDFWFVSENFGSPSGTKTHLQQEKPLRKASRNHP